MITNVILCSTTSLNLKLMINQDVVRKIRSSANQCLHRLKQISDKEQQYVIVRNYLDRVYKQQLHWESEETKQECFRCITFFKVYQMYCQLEGDQD